MKKCFSMLCNKEKTEMAHTGSTPFRFDRHGQEMDKNLTFLTFCYFCIPVLPKQS